MNKCNIFNRKSIYIDSNDGTFHDNCVVKLKLDQAIPVDDGYVKVDWSTKCLEIVHIKDNNISILINKDDLKHFKMAQYLAINLSHCHCPD